MIKQTHIIKQDKGKEEKQNDICLVSSTQIDHLRRGERVHLQSTIKEFFTKRYNGQKKLAFNNNH